MEAFINPGTQLALLFFCLVGIFFTGILYLFCTGWKKLQQHAASFSFSLEALYLPHAARNGGKILVFSVAFFAFIGFLFPGQQVSLDRILLDKALQFNKEGKYKEALSLLLMFDKQRSVLAANEKGVAYIGLRNYVAAENALKEAIQIVPDYSPPYANLAALYRDLGKSVEASAMQMKFMGKTKIQVDPEQLYGLGSSLVTTLLPRLLFACLFGMVGFWLPTHVVRHLRNRRMERFDSMLPDGMAMITNALMAGLSFQQAIEMVARESPKPLNQEFSMVLKEHSIGKSLDEAVWTLAERLPTRDAKMFANAVVTLRQTGGNLTEMFENLSQTMRQRVMLREKVKAMTAEAVGQAYILGILPFLLAWFLSEFSPDVFRIMYTTPIGWVVIIFCVFWGGLGLFTMLKMVKVKV